MKTLKHSIKINATPERVWQTLWDSEKYKQWTKPFNEGSYYKADKLAEGSKIQFLSPEGDGMYSLIDTMKENQYMAFKVLGEVKNFEEMPPTKETESWIGAMETYTLYKTPDGTELVSSVETDDKYADYMDKAFTKALQEVKTISETK